MIKEKGPNRIMKASSRTLQNQRGDPLFPRWRRQPGEISSTAERVVRHAPCPVLTVRKPVPLAKHSTS